MTTADQESSAPGWEAISAHLGEAYSDQAPLHFGTLIKYRMGGTDPIDGFDVLRVEEPTPHWHYVTYGFSELYDKESEDPEVSGFGFELTLRLVRYPDEEEPPRWAFGLLQNLARYVFSTGNTFDEGHKMNLNGPLAVDEETCLEALAVTLDPTLGELETLHGHLKFLQVVGITMDEHDIMQGWNSKSFLEMLRDGNESLITDLRRQSLLEDCALAERIGQQMKEEGSNQESFFAPFVEWEVGGEKAPRARLRMGANAVGSLRLMLAGRIQHGRHFHISGPDASISVLCAHETGWKVEDGRMILSLTEKLAAEMERTLLPQRGEYAWEDLPGFTVEVVPSEIRDTSGKEIIRIIG